MTTSRAKTAMSGGGKKSKSKSSGHPHEIRIRKGKSGGHIVTHHHLSKDGQMPDVDEHVLPDQASLLQHIAANTDAAPAPAPTPDPSQMQQAPPQGAAPVAPQPGM